MTDGCDCTELCSMGPTCPGGMLARLPGSGCARTLDGVTRDAELSADGLYRWSLTRRWSTLEPLLAWIMLNPSTADALVDDPTIRRCMGFARLWGFGGIQVVNLYAFRATKPADLWLADDPVGVENENRLRRVLVGEVYPGHPVVAAWGANARPAQVKRLLELPGADRLHALRVTKAGAPGHPLYIPADTTLTRWPA